MTVLLQALTRLHTSISVINVKKEKFIKDGYKRRSCTSTTALLFNVLSFLNTYKRLSYRRETALQGA